MATPDATWRVYLAEWLTVYTSDATGGAGADECEGYFAAKYEGRVRDEDWRIEDLNRSPLFHVQLQLWLPNLRGEYKDRRDAEKAADALAADPPYDGAALFIKVVQRGSPEERELLNYGRKMLPDAG